MCRRMGSIVTVSQRVSYTYVDYLCVYVFPIQRIVWDLMNQIGCIDIIPKVFIESSIRSSTKNFSLFQRITLFKSSVSKSISTDRPLKKLCIEFSRVGVCHIKIYCSVITIINMKLHVLQPRPESSILRPVLHKREGTHHTILLSCLVMCQCILCFVSFY